MSGRPKLTTADAAALAASLFGLSCTAVLELNAYDDRNFKIECAGGAQFVLKVHNASADFDQLEATNGAMLHLASHGVPCNALVLGQNRRYICTTSLPLTADLHIGITAQNVDQTPVPAAALGAEDTGAPADAAAPSAMGRDPLEADGSEMTEEVAVRAGKAAAVVGARAAATEAVTASTTELAGETTSAGTAATTTATDSSKAAVALPEASAPHADTAKAVAAACTATDTCKAMALNSEDTHASLRGATTAHNCTSSLHKDRALSAKQQHYVRCMTYLPGKLLKEAPQCQQLLRSTGRCLGRLSAALSSFQSPTLASPDAVHDSWYMPHAAPTVRRVLPGVSAFGDEQRALLLATVADFEAAAPLLQQGRWQVCHTDANEANLLVDDAGMEVTGVIDFGDLSFTYLAVELANSLTYMLLLNMAAVDGPLAACRALVAAYQSVFPLTAQELATLPTLLCMRLALSLTMGAAAAMQDPANAAYVLITQQHGWSLLALLRSLGSQAVKQQLL